MSKSASPQPGLLVSPNTATFIYSLSPTSSSLSLGQVLPIPAKPKAPSVKPQNVFSNDGSFLDRIRRSKKVGVLTLSLPYAEEEDKRKEKEALERKKNFADRFKNRGKRPAPSSDPASDITAPEDEQSPQKKPRISVDTQELEEGRSAQGTWHDSDLSKKPHSTHLVLPAEYQRAVGSYTPSLKDSGTGVRPLVK
ncbi:unnamed protein product [Cyclocybe aegerita]|uniref:Uncharacterized protein n=1 Tax=Cyclocybe aegerita TaxID=1973307 RepID=A0A8S0VUW8_CYCAE|nr:unnamed protein product [Cyclocybe aegerita]